MNVKESSHSQLVELKRRINIKEYNKTHSQEDMDSYLYDFPEREYLLADRLIRIAPPDTPGFSYGEEGGASLNF